MSVEYVPLGHIAKQSLRPVSVVAGEKYRTFGVKWWGEGAYERETIDGAQTKAKSLFLIQKDDLVINKIWVRHGSVAIASKSVDGCAASNEFPTFELDRSRVEPQWIHWLTKTRHLWNECAKLSQGSSGKDRIKPERFLTVQIPLPPLTEQRRIVGRLEHLASKIEEARGLRQKVSTEVTALPRAVIFQDNAEAEMVPMSDLVRLKAPDVTVQAHETYSFAGVYSFGRGVFRGDTKRGDSFKYPKLTRVSAGNFTYPKLMAWEGALGVVPLEANGLVVSTEFPVFEVDTERVFSEVLDTYFRTPSVWPTLAEASSGTNVRRRRLHPSNFMKLLFPLPSRAVQLQHQEVLAQSQKALELQAQTRAELDALLPSILDKAFRGEL
jgi:type I restriction enzyme S subunit